jgi:hypothetical protein
LNISKDGAHVSHGGVISKGGNRRVTSGGSTGTRNGQVYGGSRSSGYGQQNRAWSKSHTFHYAKPQYGTPQSYGAKPAIQRQPKRFNVRRINFR